MATIIEWVTTTYSNIVWCTLSITLFVLQWSKREKHNKIDIGPFGMEEWQKHGETINNVPPIPAHILEYLNSPCPFWPKYLVCQTHFLCLMPAGITIARLQTVTKLHSNCYHPNKGVPSDKPYWFLITKRIIPTSRDVGYNQQQELVATYNYRLPTILEACTTVVCARLLGAIIYSHDCRMTRCQGTIRDYISIGYSDNCVVSYCMTDRLAANGVGAVWCPGDRQYELNASHPLD